MTMDAVILAAGLGTRLRPHTNTTPKPLLPVQGRPILDWIIGALPREVDRLVVVTNYLAEQIDTYLAKQTHVRNCTTVRQEVPRGTGDALRSCRALVTSDRLLVLNGDDLYGAADLATLASKPAGVLAHPVDEARKWGVVTPKADHPELMDRLEEKPDRDGPALANIGAYVFPRSVFDIELTLSKRNEYEITEAVDVLAKRGPFHVVRATFWLPIGTVEAWQAAQTADLATAKR
jgi:bifunctional UDP-N-acetylglucosamine pyrophosphorylase/glucosamine-1-phosphate N-acetyltransferase